MSKNPMQKTKTGHTQTGQDRWPHMTKVKYMISFFIMSQLAILAQLV